MRRVLSAMHSATSSLLPSFLPLLAQSSDPLYLLQERLGDRARCRIALYIMPGIDMPITPSYIELRPLRRATIGRRAAFQRGFSAISRRLLRIL